jgi:2'-phosphotransferase
MPATASEALAEQPSDIPQSTGKSGGGRKGGNRGGLSRDVQVSKALSKLLRHDAQKAGLKLDEEGFADVGEVVSEISFWL